MDFSNGILTINVEENLIIQNIIIQTGCLWNVVEHFVKNSPRGGREVFLPDNQDLADILGRTDLDFVGFHFLMFWG